MVMVRHGGANKHLSRSPLHVFEPAINNLTLAKNLTMLLVDEMLENQS